MVNLAIMVYDEDSVQTDAHGTVRHGICLTVTETRMERIEFVWEDVTDILQRGYLKYLRLSVDHLTLERAQKAVGTQNHWTIRHHKDLILNNALYILSSVVC
jgi:riboflavin synthase alpha subunit